MGAAWHWITSYPMRCVGKLFTDVVNRKPVNLYVDRHGRMWMAQHRWQIQRVAWQSKNPHEKTQGG